MAGFNWYGKEVKLLIKNATEDALESTAFLIEGAAKVRISTNQQVDTGFMLNSVYTKTRRSSGYSGIWPTGRYPQSPAKHGGDSSPVPREPQSEVQFVSDDQFAAVAVGAEYGIYQESKQSFLYQALLDVAPQVGGMIQESIKQVGG